MSPARRHAAPVAHIVDLYHRHREPAHGAPLWLWLALILWQPVGINVAHAHSPARAHVTYAQSPLELPQPPPYALAHTTSLSGAGPISPQPIVIVSIGRPHTEHTSAGGSGSPSTVHTTRHTYALGHWHQGESLATNAAARSSAATRRRTSPLKARLLTRL